MIWLLIFLMQLHTLLLPAHLALSRILPEAFMTLGAFHAFSLQAQAVLHSLDSTLKDQGTLVEVAATWLLGDQTELYSLIIWL